MRSGRCAVQRVGGGGGPPLPDLRDLSQLASGSLAPTPGGPPDLEVDAWALGSGRAGSPAGGKRRRPTHRSAARAAPASRRPGLGVGYPPSRQPRRGRLGTPCPRGPGLSGPGLLSPNSWPRAALVSLAPRPRLRSRPACPARLDLPGAAASALPSPPARAAEDPSSLRSGAGYESPFHPTGSPQAWSGAGGSRCSGPVATEDRGRRPVASLVLGLGVQNPEPAIRKEKKTCLLCVWRLSGEVLNTAICVRVCFR